MSEETQVTFYRLSVEVPRLIAALPFDPKKIQTVKDVYVIGDLPAASALHAVNLYWQHCPHKKPGLLDLNGEPIRVAPLKRRDIRARLRRADEPPIGQAKTLPAENVTRP